MRILTNIKGNQADFLQKAGQGFIKPFSIVFGHTYSIEDSISKKHTSTINKVITTFISVIILPLTLLFGAIGAIMVTCSSSHKNAYKQIQEEQNHNNKKKTHVFPDSSKPNLSPISPTSITSPLFTKIPAKITNQVSETADSAVKRVVIVANKSVFIEHITGNNHPESPKRVEVIEQTLRKNQLMNDENTVKPRQATQDEISLCHDLSYQEELLKQINHLENHGYSSFNNRQWKVDYVPGDFIISPATYNTSLYAAGAPLTAIDYILDEKNNTSKAFCIVRPPGHHAHQDTGSGFCVFNNVAIAAKYLTSQYNFNRVLIVDWDAHHGDGTQKLIEKDENIFYFSTHKNTSKGFYPGPHWGHEKDNCHNILNCPVSGSPEESREQIIEAFKNKLVPAMDLYKPDFVLISCGFDAHEDDTLVGLGLKTEDYAEFTRICMGIAEKYAKGRIVSVLEDGYNLQAISDAARAHVETLAVG